MLRTKFKTTGGREFKSLQAHLTYYEYITMTYNKLKESNWTIRNETLEIKESDSFEKSQDNIKLALTNDTMYSLEKLSDLRLELFGKK